MVTIPACIVRIWIQTLVSCIPIVFVRQMYHALLINGIKSMPGVMADGMKVIVLILSRIAMLLKLVQHYLSHPKISGIINTSKKV